MSETKKVSKHEDGHVSDLSDDEHYAEKSDGRSENIMLKRSVRVRFEVLLVFVHCRPGRNESLGIIRHLKCFECSYQST